MDIFTYYDASPGFTGSRAESFRAWAASWAKLGWTPRILTVRKAKQSPLYPKIFPRVGKAALPYLALHAAGGGWYAPTSAINYDFRPRCRRNRAALYHDGVVWATKRGTEEILNALGTKEWDSYFLLKFLTLDLLGKRAC
jgi:hypothetical protein